MSTKIGWSFPDANGGQTHGFNDSSIDTFIGSRLQSLVRETIQNSLDARKSENDPVVVDFSLVELKKQELNEVTQLVTFLKFARSAALNQSGTSSEAHKFYEKAIRNIEQSSNIPIFCIHDFNTRGLEGTTDEDSFEVGPWKALVKGSGLSVKNRSDALGSFGHGSKATFAISELRTVFYYSEVLIGNKIQKRFQGKSILQSMQTDRVKKTQGVGYFGAIDRCEPLIDDDAPMWTQKLRSLGRGTTGTSIFIPFPDITLDTRGIWDEIELCILSNFYYAILMNNLEIYFNGRIALNNTNLRDKFDALLERIDQNEQKIEKEVRDALQTTISINSPNEGLKGSHFINNFGYVEFYMRLGKEIEGRTVGIARQNGMLLTRKPLYLTRFSGTQPFDLFLCVTDNKGSEFLRRLENPAHNNFEFDRINDPEERRIFKSKYKSFTDDVREFVLKFAAIDASDEALTDDLDDFLGALEDNLSSDLGKEKSNSLIIEERGVQVRKPTSKEAGFNEDESTVTPGDSRNVAKGGKSSKVGDELLGSFRNRQLVEVVDPRIVKIGTRTAQIFFTPQTKSAFWLKLFRSGNQISDEMKFRPDGASEFKSEVFFPERSRIKRESLTVELNADDFSYAIEIVSQVLRDEK